MVNVSMGDGEGSEPFRRAYSQKIFPALEAFRPGVIVISAGFDAHKDDPLAGIVLDAEDYRWVTREICAVAHRVRQLLLLLVLVLLLLKSCEPILAAPPRHRIAICK